MCLALACCKGRAKSVHLQSVMLKLASLSLASGCRLRVRWVPSERNPSDRLSRGHLGWFSGFRAARRLPPEGDAAGRAWEGKGAGQGTARDA
eukprot:8914473-Pyramimonas_sp.AAC.1